MTYLCPIIIDTWPTILYTVFSGGVGTFPWPDSVKPPKPASEADRGRRQGRQGRKEGRQTVWSGQAGRQQTIDR